LDRSEGPLRGEGDERTEQACGEAASREVVVVDVIGGGCVGEHIGGGQLHAEQFGQGGDVQLGFGRAKVGFWVSDFNVLGCYLKGRGDEEGGQASREPRGDSEEEQPDEPEISFEQELHLWVCCKCGATDFSITH